MKCCICEKEVDVSKNTVPPSWFGTYVGDKLKRIVCTECIKHPAVQQVWRQDAVKEIKSQEVHP